MSDVKGPENALFEIIVARTLTEHGRQNWEVVGNVLADTAAALGKVIAIACDYDHTRIAEMLEGAHHVTVESAAAMVNVIKGPSK